MTADPSALGPKSILRLRARPHLHPDRGGEAIVEVVREGVVVATIYGSREGVHIVSPCFEVNVGQPRSFVTNVRGAMPGLLVPLLRPGETCPWCAGLKMIEGGAFGLDCPLCTENQKEP